tara:strand:- start:438 stop:584 length:147 start_codon:yes stop_codon:yes gene_type:complete
MNLVEFLFAFFTVFGVSGFWWAWTSFVYGLENKEEKTDEDIIENRRTT